jgi:hypothetical protein
MSIAMRTRSVHTNRPGRPGLQQAQAALLVLAFVVGQVGSFLHAAFERHTVCAEHGEIVHVPGHADGGPPGHAAAEIGLTGGQAEASRDARDALRDGSAASAEHAHDHCYLCPASRQPLDARPSSDAIAAVVPGVVASPLPAVVASSDRARYIIAPKTSPPV